MITRETDYAIRLLRTLSDGERRTAAQTAQQEMVPLSFAYKILKKLSRAGLIEASRGADGGCRLVADLEKVTLYDLIEAMGENCRLSGCMASDSTCPWRQAHGNCTVHNHLSEIQTRLNEELKAHTLAAILRDPV